MLAFGFFFFVSSACGTLFHSGGQPDEAFEQGEYETALAAVNERLREEPENRQLLVLKAETLEQLAVKQDHPEERVPYYREMRSTLDILSGDVQEEQAEEIARRAREHELDEALRLMETRENPDSGAPARIVAHLENAILIDPMHADTYSIKSDVHYNSGELAMALETLRRAERYIERLPFAIREKIAFLLLEEGDIPQAIELYEELLEEQPGNNAIRHGLVNAYILGEEHEQSVALLRELLREESENYSYHQSLATELFFLIRERIDLLVEGSLPAGADEERIEELLGWMEEAETRYESVRELHPDPDEIIYITAAFYKNAASQLIRLSGYQTDNESAFEEKALELLTRSVPIWQEVTERYPENPEVWRSIYRIYSQLGMEQEAEQARSRANF